jgi:hypothetical protein
MNKSSTLHDYYEGITSETWLRNKLVESHYRTQDAIVSTRYAQMRVEAQQGEHDDTSFASIAVELILTELAYQIVCRVSQMTGDAGLCGLDEAKTATAIQQSLDDLTIGDLVEWCTDDK